MNRRIEDFITWASALAVRRGRPQETISDDPHGAMGTERFRRTLAWHIARRPGGLVALAIQHGHMRTAVSAGYAARSRDGIHDLLDIETARATADTLAALRSPANAAAVMPFPVRLSLFRPAICEGGLPRSRWAPAPPASYGSRRQSVVWTFPHTAHNAHTQNCREPFAAGSRIAIATHSTWRVIGTMRN
jgi:hypothetical protein